ncbi:hypothetical protein FPV67DRAFT_1665706 [Lyophyllum atratum]|nr:hypothetical protein FPV67DRAFT_1665706 [Lyophyllum atratum]
MVVPLNVPTGALYIRSSESIKSALSPTFHMTHRHRDVRCRLAASQYKASRLKGLKEATQRKLSAQQAMADTCLHENDVLMRVVDAGRGGFGIIDAIALAQAARDSLVAEAHTAVTKVKECELKLEVLRDSVEEAQARVEEANQQLGMLMEVIDSAGIHIPAAYRQSSPSSSTLDRSLNYDIQDVDLAFGETFNPYDRVEWRSTRSGSTYDPYGPGSTNPPTGSRSLPAFPPSSTDSSAVGSELVSEAYGSSRNVAESQVVSRRRQRNSVRRYNTPSENYLTFYPQDTKKGIKEAKSIFGLITVIYGEVFYSELHRPLAMASLTRASEHLGQAFTSTGAVLNLVEHMATTVRTHLKEAGEIVAGFYGLEDIGAADCSHADKKRLIAQKVKDLIEDDNYTVYGGVGPGKFNSPACYTVLNAFLYTKATSLGRVYREHFGPAYSPQVLALGFFSLRFNLERWRTGECLAVPMQREPWRTTYRHLAMKIARAFKGEFGAQMRLLSQTWYDDGLEAHRSHTSGIASSPMPHASFLRAVGSCIHVVIDTDFGIENPGVPEWIYSTEYDKTVREGEGQDYPTAAGFDGPGFDPPVDHFTFSGVDRPLLEALEAQAAANAAGAAEPFTQLAAQVAEYSAVAPNFLDASGLSFSLDLDFENMVSERFVAERSDFPGGIIVPSANLGPHGQGFNVANLAGAARLLHYPVPSASTSSGRHRPGVPLGAANLAAAAGPSQHAIPTLDTTDVRSEGGVAVPPYDSSSPYII